MLIRSTNSCQHNASIFSLATCVLVLAFLLHDERSHAHNFHVLNGGEGGGGGAALYKKKLNSLYNLSKKCPDGLRCFLYFMNEKFNKKAKVEKLTKKLRRCPPYGYRSFSVLIVLNFAKNK